MLWQLFWTFFKIGAFTFGSGYAMIPLIEQEVVDKKKWFDKESFFDQFSLAQSCRDHLLSTPPFLSATKCEENSVLSSQFSALSFHLLLLYCS